MMEDKILIQKNQLDKLVIDLKDLYENAYTDGYKKIARIFNPYKFIEMHFHETTDLYPFYIDGIGLCYKSGQLNHFGGLDVPYQQVLKLAAGYYIGTLYLDMEIGGGVWLRNSSDSEKYFEDRHVAEFQFKLSKFLPKITP